MIRTCDKCSATIPHGNPYICLTHNIEYMDTNLETRQERINVIDSDEVLILCSNCGNRMTKAAIKQILRIMPISRRTILSN